MLLIQLPALLSAPIVASAAHGPGSGAVLRPGDRLMPGQFLTAGNGYFVMQPDGQLAVCAKVAGRHGDSSCASELLWSSGTSHSAGAFALMQEIGVLSVFPASALESGGCSPGGAADCRLWQSHTMAAAGCNSGSSNCSFVEIQKDANIVMRTGAGPEAGAGGRVIWSTGTKLMPEGTKNVLWMIADDMRPDMKVAYGQEQMITPAFDRLATEGSVFTRAYCQIAVCAPSRNSFLSGLRPDVTGIFNFANHIREPGQPPIVTVPQQFRDWGYTTLGGGKTFHYNLPPYWDDTMQGSWSTRLQPYYPFWEFVGSSDFAYCPIEGVPQHWPEGGALAGSQGKGASYCVVNGSISEQIYDYRLATHTIGTLQLAKRQGRPFFVMAGFRRPHRDFLVHQQYWDLYPDATELATAKYPVRSKSQPLIAFHPAGFVLPNGTSYPGNPDLAWPVEIQQIARKAYYTAITQTDAQVGRVLSELEAEYSYDRAWLVERMARMARGQGSQATRDGYIVRPPSSGPDDTREL